MEHSTGLEPALLGLGTRCVIRLHYEHIQKKSEQDTLPVTAVSLVHSSSHILTHHCASSIPHFAICPTCPKAAWFQKKRVSEPIGFPVRFISEIVEIYSMISTTTIVSRSNNYVNMFRTFFIKNFRHRQEA